ncbi:MAG: 4-alpha-glucanotransferase [Pyrinomonadaceae bacterium]
MKFPRTSGILLHPTSLPGEFGIGDLGPEAYSFVEFLKNAGQSRWQILPLGPTGYGDSPYQCFSAFAGNTLLISPEKLVEDGVLTSTQAADHPIFPADRVDYGAVFEWKTRILLRAFDDVQRKAPAKMLENFDAFQHENGWWLDEYALYRAIKANSTGAAWYEWPDDLKRRDPKALEDAWIGLSEDIRREKFYQFLFFQQWELLKNHANELGIQIIGDMPIFVALDSADVWCNQDKFKLNPDGSPRVVAGVPPDFFSKTGQLWGNPIYDWEAMRADGFGWWTARFASGLRQTDIIRADHFRGFCSSWEVPGADKTAENGSWVDVPGRELFSAVQARLGPLPVIAEDLGVITPDVDALRDEFDFPGMRILQFGFGGDAANLHLPHNYLSNCVAYTGTHDNDTTAGWWRSLPRASSAGAKPDQERSVRDHCLSYLNTEGSEINWDLIRGVWASVADTAIAPLQDVLGIGSSGRMNLPASADGNWSWRFSKGDLDEAKTERLRGLTELYGRVKNPSEHM